MSADTLHLVLKHHWYDETTKAIDPKRIEYRAITPRWLRLIYGRQKTLKWVRFARGYTKTTATFAITKIDIGPCLIPGYEGERIRIHFSDSPNHSTFRHLQEMARQLGSPTP